MQVGNYITTYTNIQFDPFNPKEEDIKTEDIAHALSLLCRANGHFSNFYSVGQHSINCAKEAEARGYSTKIQFACLLHDASEAYLSDVTRPVKKRLPEYLEIEEKLQKQIFTAYNLTEFTQKELKRIKDIDDQMLDYELEILLNNNQAYKGHLVAEHNLDFIKMNEVKNEFIRWVNELQKQL